LIKKTYRDTMTKVLLNFSCLLVLALMLGSAACDRKKPRYELMIFDVDSALLEPPITDTFLNISIAAPKHWSLVEASTLERLLAQASDKIGATLPVEPRWMFLNGASQAMCIVSRLTSAEIPTGEEALRSLEASFVSKFPQATVRGAVFLKDEFRVHQVMVSTPEAVMIKLLLDAPTVPMFAVDYIIPRAAYEGELRAVESSIGSIKPL